MTDPETQTRTAKTVHGDVPYETVTCSSCGTEVWRKSAKAFAIGDEYKQQYGTTQLSAPTATGWVCEHCADAPAAYPDTNPVFAAAHHLREYADACLYGEYNMLKEVVFIYVMGSLMVFGVLALAVIL